MSQLIERAEKMSQELIRAISGIDPDQFEYLISSIERARKIALFAGGREGLMIKALAMRLFHLGYDVSVVGDMTAPFLTKGDVLILGVGPGYVSTVDALRSVAQRDGAQVVCITAQPNGKTSGAADAIVVIPSQTMADDQGEKAVSILPMGSLFEFALFALGELVVLELLHRSGKTFGEARDRHTNLE
jgi:6-phospho-3-hexuloisomerase